MQAINWLLVLVRVSALLTVFPLFTGPNFPARLRAALAALLAFLIAPQLPPIALNQTSFSGLIYLLAMEIGIGLLLGFAGRMLFFVVDAAGSIVATELGLDDVPVVQHITIN